MYVEFDTTTGHTIGDDKGVVHFSLQGTQSNFRMEGTSPGSNYDINVYYDALTTQNNPTGTVRNLGWVHSGTVPFILAGNSGNFWSNNPPASWVQDMLPVFSGRSLREFILPGSHDSGMSQIAGHTAMAGDMDTLTQTLSIGGQLQAGARYFDIRPVIANGQYATGHYSYTGSTIGWQGGNGQNIASIIHDINAFTAGNPELIILNLSHDLDTDAANSQYTTFSQQQWNSLFDLFVNNLNDMFVASWLPTGTDLTHLPLGWLLGNQKASVIIVCDLDAGITLGDYSTKGFYTYSQYNLTNLYADTSSLGSMESNQFDKLSQYRTGPDSQPFLLSWTLTQDAGAIVGQTSILDLASQANNAVYAMVPPKVSPQVFPNVLYLDNYHTSDFTALTIALNFLAYPAPVTRGLPARHHRRAQH